MLLLAAVLSGCVSEALEGPADVFFAPLEPVELALTLPAPSRNALLERPREYVRAQMEVDGWSTVVGIRLKGRGSFRRLDSGEKPAFKIDFTRYRPEARFYGMDGLTLNNMVSDPSLLAETACYGAFGAAGHATLRSRHARVTLDGEDLGLLLALEHTDRAFLERTFGDSDGNQYEGTWAVQGTERVFADFTVQGIPVFEHDTVGVPKGRADLAALVAALDTSDDDPEALSGLVDVQDFLTFAALELWTLHWDGYIGTRNNYRVYSDPEHGFRFVPWGCDDAMRHTELLHADGFARPTGAPGRLWRMVQEDDAFRDAWLERLSEVNTKLAASTLYEDLVRTADAIEPEVADSAMDSAEAWEGGRTWVVGTLETQPDRVADLFDLPPSGGSP